MASTTLEELVLAYRRAKSDLYYSSIPRSLELLDYEDEIEANLEGLLERINGDDSAWVDDARFLGGFTLLPKSLSPGEGAGDGLIHSNPVHAWDARGSGQVATAQFRLMSMCSIDLHVLSTLWLMTAGAKFEGRLGSEAMGNRLRRDRNGRLNRLAPTSFKYYLNDFRQWRDGGLAAIRSALSADKKVVAITADAECYYHRLDAEFLLEPDFIERVMEADLTRQESRIHHLFVRAVRSWMKVVASRLGTESLIGLPVGLPASAVVANLALIELDRTVLEEVKPIYYGRYVDDIILVFEDSGDLHSEEDVWAWISSRSRGHLVSELKRDLSSDGDSSDAAGLTITFQAQYLRESDIRFNQQKSKTFLLEGSSGHFIVESIRRTINERASEWRSLPSLPVNPRDVGGDVAAATRSDGAPADSLLDVDVVTAKRASFAIRLRDFEAFERDVEPTSWRPHRAAFFEALATHVLSLPGLFHFAHFVPRLIKLAVSAGDTDCLARLALALADSFRRIDEALESGGCKVQVKPYGLDDSSSAAIAALWRERLTQDVYEAVAASVSPSLTAKALQEAVEPILALDPSKRQLFRIRHLRELHMRLFVRDLAHRPYRYLFLAPDFVPGVNLPRPPREALSSVSLRIEQDIREGFDALADALGGKVLPEQWFREPSTEEAEARLAPGLLFATRPLNMLEVYLLLHSKERRLFAFRQPAIVRRIMKALRGYALDDDVPRIRGDETIIVPDGGGSDPGRVTIALAMLDTSNEAWTQAVMKTPDLSRHRYETLNRVLSEVLSEPRRAHYLLLPELAMPSVWFVHFARKLGMRGTNLVSGIEYRHGEAGTVRNQVWAALNLGRLGFPAQAIYQQDKQTPAEQEERNLHDLNNLRLVPEVKWEDGVGRPPVIKHGDFMFALLVCSELTNIDYRALLRGKVDALFVPEWNRDLGTFGSLVESCALDIHAFIVQANHRKFGDSRIRGPFSKRFRRDVVRLQGGEHDYTVVASIDYGLLRQHQSSYRSVSREFKPVPDGFEISPDRKATPRMD